MVQHKDKSFIVWANSIIGKVVKEGNGSSRKGEALDWELSPKQNGVIFRFEDDFKISHYSWRSIPRKFLEEK